MKDKTCIDPKIFMQELSKVQLEVQHSAREKAIEKPIMVQQDIPHPYLV